jgi:HAD superfamily hydrolase (TIGR01549 family)
LPAYAQRYRAWLVDLDGTLYRQTPVRIAMAIELMVCGVRWAPVLREFRRSHELLRARSGSQDPFAAQLELTAQRTGMAAARIEGPVREWMIERPLKWLRLARRTALLEAISSYRRGGGKTALVSDYPARAKLGALSALELFEAIVASGEPDGPPWLKPDPSGYLAAAERLGVVPAECLVLGDRDDADGAAARAAGMHFLLIH